MKYTEFKDGMTVQVAECYLQDECTENQTTSKTATVIGEPADDEELIMIRYEDGSLDHVPQDIMEPFDWDYTSEHGEKYTKADFFRIAKGNSYYAFLLRDRVTWEHPETIVEGDLIEGEIEEENGTYIICVPE